ncbi:ROK family protein [Zavarzinella formosa]|uniref:ROK family protein n=1 Tax=Zavarzinella formosa TaxID=360055 RepID=UPI0002DB1699|nr:ROK family protein [Zavarzinella formosa]
MSVNAYYVGLDVGGTTMKAAVVDEGGKVCGTATMSTEAFKGQEHGLNQMVATIRKSVEVSKLSMSDIASIGVATPGTMDIPAGIILDPPNLKPWRNVPVKKHIQEVFQIPTAFQNDANAAAYGEFWIGAGKDVQSMVMFTLGTGIGGGIIIHDHVMEGQHSHGGEIGHMKIQMTPDGRLCGCGRRGCLEAYASATSVVKRAKEALATQTGDSILKNLLDATTEELPAKVVFQAADQGDETAKKVIDDTAYFLGVGAMNIMHLIDPDMIVFAGGMTAAGDPFLNRIRHYIHELAFPVPAAKTIVQYALLGSDAGFIGAAACGRQLVKK